MNINWYGQTCFRINTQRNKNGLVNILIDPLGREDGFRSPKLEADIFLSSSGFEIEKKKLSSAAGNYFLITGPGEYDIKGVYIQGLSAKTSRSQRDSPAGSGTGKIEGKKTVIYTLESEGIKICHLGRLGGEELSPDQVEKIGEVDILMVPIGGPYGPTRQTGLGGETANAKEALKVVSQIEPKIIIPMYYKIPKLKIKLGGLNEFLKLLGIKSLPPLAKLSIKKKDISKEEAKIIVLEP